MESELDYLCRQIAVQMARVNEIMHENRPDGVTVTLCGCKYNNRTVFYVSWHGRDWSKGENSLLCNYYGTGENLSKAAIEAVAGGNLVNSEVQV